MILVPGYVKISDLHNLTNSYQKKGGSLAPRDLPVTVSPAASWFEI